MAALVAEQYAPVAALAAKQYAPVAALAADQYAPVAALAAEHPQRDGHQEEDGQREADDDELEVGEEAARGLGGRPHPGQVHAELRPARELRDAAVQTAAEGAEVADANGTSCLRD